MPRGSVKLLILFCALSFAFAPAALAQSVSTSVQADVDGVLTSDVQPLTSAMNASSVLYPPGITTLEDFARTGYGRAVQNLDGVAAVSAEGLFNNTATSNSIVSDTYWTRSATNNTSGPVNYLFNFLVSPPSLRLGDYSNVSDTTPNAPVATFILEIRANGVVVFHADATLTGGLLGHVLTENGTSLNPVFTAGVVPEVFGYNFDSISNTIDLGTYSPGATVTVEYEMTASVVSGGLEVGGRAAVGDPFDLGGSPGFTGTLVDNGAVPNEETSIGRIKAKY